MMAMKRMSMLSHSHLSPRAQELASNIKNYMEDSEKETIDAGRTVTHYNGDAGSSNGHAHSDDELDKLPEKLKETDDVTEEQKHANTAPAAPVEPIDTTGRPDRPGQLSPPVAQLKEASLSDTQVQETK